MSTPDDLFDLLHGQPDEHDVGAGDPRVEEWLTRDEGKDTCPRWLWVLIGDGGVDGQRVWVRFFADDAPHGRYVLSANAPRPGVADVRVVSPVLPGTVLTFKTGPVVEVAAVLIGAREAAALLGISVRALYSRVERGQLKGAVVRSGRRMQFHKDLLLARVQKGAR